VTRFALVFAALLAVLFGAELTAPVQHAIVVPWTEALARATAALRGVRGITDVRTDGANHPTVAASVPAS
jgi:hypothetical protein